MRILSLVKENNYLRIERFFAIIVEKLGGENSCNGFFGLWKMCCEVTECRGLLVGILPITTAGLRLTYNERFGKMAALPRGIIILLFSRRLLALKKPRCRHLAKPPPR
jgi:hypothetical protein